MRWLVGVCVQVVLADGTGLDVWQDQGCRVKRPMAFLARYAM